ncbi:hypothetical protein [Nannocystis punicea]|uniref:Uncharacterized protein n=1 Tax=Nannocystis punicea TaxID=2995304 RepID=A0ABY7HDV3_9BACT|nr:hypothetical protein [Nannocystis poenicansa]WAS97453.1 hypothetical protein O0S08_15005 [Nannocystis poenicansa]
MSFAALVVGGTLVVGQAVGLGEPSGCAATAMIAGARANVPVTADSQQRLARFDAASASAQAAERATDRHERRKRCADALLAYADLAPEVYGRERGESEASRARQLAAAASLGVDAYVSPRAPLPAPTPEQQWERRRRRLVGHTAASGVFTGVGVAMMTVPWIVLAASCRPESFCEGYGAIWLSGFGAPIFVASVIPLGIWATRLHRHLRARPPGLALSRGRARLELHGSGLRLDF